MRIVLVVLALLLMAGFIYLNDYQHDVMMEGMESSQPDPRLESLEARLGAIDTVFVLITDESQRALYDAAVENPGKTIHELGIATEDRVLEIQVGDDGQTVLALVVFTHEDAVWNEVTFRTDAPVYVLDKVRRDTDISHIILDPPPGITEKVPESIVLDKRLVTTLFWRLK